MSQVIVTVDRYKAKREASRAQELKITQDVRLAKWQMSDISGKDPFAKMVGLAVLPILGMWMGLMAVMMLMMSFLRYLFKGLGAIVGGRKS